jgi:hypothetical protein
MITTQPLTCVAITTTPLDVHVATGPPVNSGKF